jgi:type I restriction enzyme M protein
VLVLQRKTDADYRRESRQGGLSDYEIFMAQVHAIGHDKRGNTVFKRNEDGEEIWVPADAAKAIALDRTAAGGATIRPLPRQKLVDDDTPRIAEDFLRWKSETVLGW